jgi:hypothetical protein
MASDRQNEQGERREDMRMGENARVFDYYAFMMPLANLLLLFILREPSVRRWLVRVARVLVG